MKKCIYLFVIAFLFANLSVKANPGDTTWVQANVDTLRGGGNYDSMITFPAPGTTYRKIYMYFTLGKYMCPGYNPAAPGTGTGGTGWCGDWDYTVQNFLMIPGGDTVELGRFITPYANALAPRTPWSAKQVYVFDVTDYASLLTGSSTLRINFQAGSGGFTANVRFAFIEGTPERNVVGFEQLWYGSWGYGGATSINVNFPALPETAPAGTNTADLKFTVTGHGSDANGCCEFASHNYSVVLNGDTIATKAIWRTTCGANELYPQSGTWLYERGNWCPGALVYSNFHLLPGIVAGSNFDLQLQFDPYTGGGYYVNNASLFFYGAMNKTLDASLEQIISPTTDGNLFRENPVAGNPVVLVRNSGSTPITSITFQYGIVDSAMQSFTWVGTLDSLQDTEITLPSGLYQLNNIAGASTADTYGYIVQIASVNGTTDDDSTNNTITSRFVAAPLWPSTVVIWLKTNNENLISDPAVSETSWVLYDMYGNIVSQRSNTALATLYRDTVTLPGGYYQLAVYDSGCDGLQWWVYTDNPSDFPGYESGYITVRKLTGVTIPLNGDFTTSGYSNDFGCGFTQSFSTGPLVQNAITNITANNAAIEAFPNPARNMVNVQITGMQQVKGTIQLIDALGRVVGTVPCNSGLQQINTGNLANGLYTVVFVDQLEQNNRLTTRLLIAR